MNFYIFVIVVLSIAFAGGINGVDSVAPVVPSGPVPPNCPKIACRLPTCAPGYTSSQLPTECCPSCKPNKVTDCSKVYCTQQACIGDQVRKTIPGQCCSQCVLDCTNVYCLDCVGITEAGRCCPTCGTSGPIAVTTV